jgi:colanic acid biosynthesis glycosyl transferase WcaI
MKFTILTQYYPPEIGAPQRRLSGLAQRMVKAGHDVTVLTAMPNYPTGRILPGYKGLVQREEIEGVNVIRTFIYPTQKASFLPRLTNYFSFVLSSALLGTFLLRRSDYLLVESPPLFLGLAGFWLSRIKRARLVFNVSDLWPESAVRLGLLREGSWSYRLSAWLESFCYRRAWLISGQSRSILDSIVRRFPHYSTFHFSNGVDVEHFGEHYATDAHRRELAPNDECVVLYAGLLGLAQGLEQIVEAANQLQSEKGLKFVMIGDGPEKQKLVAKAAQLTNIVFKDPLPASEIPPMLATADIILVPLKMHIPGAVPSKLYEAMASGKPVVLIAGGEAADIVYDHEVGCVVQSGDINNLIEVVRKLSKDDALRARLGANGRQAAERYFNRDTIVTRFTNHLEENL